MSATERTRVLLHLSPLWWGWVAGLGNFQFRAVDEEHARYRVGAAARRLLRSVRGTGEPPESRLIGRV